MTDDFIEDKAKEIAARSLSEIYETKMSALRKSLEDAKATKITKKTFGSVFNQYFNIISSSDAVIMDLDGIAINKEKAGIKLMQQGVKMELEKENNQYYHSSIAFLEAREYREMSILWRDFQFEIMKELTELIRVTCRQYLDLLEYLESYIDENKRNSKFNEEILKRMDEYYKKIDDINNRVDNLFSKNAKNNIGSEDKEDNEEKENETEEDVATTVGNFEKTLDLSSLPIELQGPANKILERMKVANITYQDGKINYNKKFFKKVWWTSLNDNDRQRIKEFIDKFISDKHG